MATDADYGLAPAPAPPPAGTTDAAYGLAPVAPTPQQPSLLSRINAPIKAVAQNVDAFMNKPETRAAMSVAMPAPAQSTVEGAENFVKGIPDMLPSAKVAQATKLFQEVEGAIGDNAVPTTDAMKTALDAVKEQTSLGGGGGSIADKVMTRLANTDEGPLTYREARILHSNLGDLTASDKMASNPKMLRLLSQFRDALGDSIEDTAQQGGKLQQYKDAMKGYAVGMQQQEKLDTIIKWAKRTGITAAGAVGSGWLAHAGWSLYKDLYGDH